MSKCEKNKIGFFIKKHGYIPQSGFLDLTKKSAFNIEEKIFLFLKDTQLELATANESIHTQTSLFEEKPDGTMSLLFTHPVYGELAETYQMSLIENGLFF